MQLHSDRFETVLPKTERFFSPPDTKQAKPRKLDWGLDWQSIIVTGIVALTIVAVVSQFTHQRPAPPAPAPTKVFSPEDLGAIRVAPTPAPPLPEVRRAAPAPIPTTPRAQLIHIRPIGTWETDRMPDGRLLQTLYKGELPSAASLPRTGGQLGDMWFTRNDGHCWVLAPATAGSQAVGWVDP